MQSEMLEHFIVQDPSLIISYIMPFKYSIDFETDVKSNYQVL